MPTNDLSGILLPAAKHTLAEDIVDRLREAIYSGQLAPNQRLREEVLASMLGLSRGPVREALAQLEREGLVIRQPNRGATVARLSLEDLDEVYSLRLALEQLAIRQAIRHAEPHHFQEMQKVIQTMAEYLDRGITTQEAATLDMSFHEIIYNASKHKRLLNFWATLRPQIHIFLLSRNVVNMDFREYILPTHQAIVDVLRQRDEAQALLTIEEHLKGAYERILKSYARDADGSEIGAGKPLGKR